MSEDIKVGDDVEVNAFPFKGIRGTFQGNVSTLHPEQADQLVIVTQDGQSEIGKPLQVGDAISVYTGEMTLKK